MTELLGADVIAEKLKRLQRPADAVVVATPYRYIRSLGDAADSYIDVLQNPGQNFTLGLSQIDVLTRGFRAGEMIFVAGYVHSGKTQLVLNAIARNRNKRILFVSLDDPTEMVLSKLVAIHHGIPADELEAKLQAQDGFYADIVRETANRIFDKLIVVDEPIDMGELDAVVGEATQSWGAPPEIVVLDYVGLMGSLTSSASDGYARISETTKALRNWVKTKEFPLMVLHQTTRGAGGPGKPIGLTSMQFGGEDTATMMIGVWRKVFDDTLDVFARAREANSVSISVPKNKRPPGKRTPHEGIDFYMDTTTGAIRRWRDDDVAGEAPVPKPQLPPEAELFADFDAELA